MTCTKNTFALPAQSKASAFLARMAFALGLPSQVTQSQSMDTSGPAQITAAKSNPAGDPNGAPTMAQRNALAETYRQSRRYKDLHRLQDVTRAILRKENYYE